MIVFIASDRDGNLLDYDADYDELLRRLGGWAIVNGPAVDQELAERAPRKRVANPYDERNPRSYLPTSDRAWEKLDYLQITLDDVAQWSEEEAVDELARFWPLKGGQVIVPLRPPTEKYPQGRDVDTVIRDVFLRQNYKTEKTTAGEERVSTIGLSLVNAQSWKKVEPRSLPGGTNLCVGASRFCTQTCLIASGRQKTLHHYKVKLALTRLMFEAPGAFGRLLLSAAAEHYACPRPRSTFIPAVRLNMFSDVPWELVFPGLFAELPQLQFYDYTKLVLRDVPANYDLTFSESGTNTETAMAEYRRGRRIAIVFNLFKGRGLPRTWRGIRVVDGDISDARFLEPTDVVVGLRYKTAGGLHYKTDADTAFVHMGVYDEQSDEVLDEVVPSQEPSAGWLEEDETEPELE